MANRVVSVDENYLFPTPLEARLSGAFAGLISGKVPVGQLPVDALVTDANVAAQVNGAQTGAAIDQRITTQATPLVHPIVADYIASSQVVVDAAAAAVNANPKIALLEQKNTAQDAALTKAKTGIRLYSENLNDVIVPDKYFQPSSATASLTLNYPFIGSNGGITLDVDSYSDTFINRIQRATSMDGKQFATRAKLNNGAWSAWAIFKPWEPLEPDAGIHQHMVRLNDMRRRIGQPVTEGRAAVALVVDHGTNNFNEIIVPLLQETGVRATIALNSQMYDPAMQRYQHDNRTNWGIVKGWHDNLGVEIANHGRTHKDQFTVEDIKTEIIGGRDELEANLPGVKIDTYVQVGLSGTNGFMGFNNGTTIESYYNTAAGRIIVDGHALYTGSLPGGRVFDLDGEPKQGVSSYWIDSGAASISTAKAQIALAVAQGKGVTIRFHPELLNTAGFTTTAEISEFLRHLGSLIAAGSVVPMTLREFNLASSGSGVHVSPDGSRFRIAVGDDGVLSSTRL